ncbi:hypothetical protein SUGI_0737320 [Cryptomeria japonica]|nr:hypothetical protein SUGI_0737320 [Cryptomeria japonica]
MSKGIIVERKVRKIFLGLREDIGLDFLWRVPFTSHPNFRAMCRSWRNAMGNPLFYQDRKRLGKEDDFLVIVESLHRKYDPPSRIVMMYYPLLALVEDSLTSPLNFDHNTINIILLNINIID